MKYFDIGDSFWEIFDRCFKSIEKYAMTKDEKDLIKDLKNFIMETTDHKC